MLALAGQIAANVDPIMSLSSAETRQIEWVRTTRGWESLDTWQISSPSRITLHPGIVAAGQLLGSLLALLALTRGKP